MIIHIKNKVYRWRLPVWMQCVVMITAILILNAIATGIELRAIDIEGQTQDAARQSSAICASDEQLSEEAQAVGDYITEIAASYGLDPKIVRALIEVESGGDPYAVGDGGDSIGLGQIQPKWHGERMARLGVTDLYDPQQNVLVICDILAEKLAEYGNLYDALSAYNAGSPCNNGYAEKILYELLNEEK